MTRQEMRAPHLDARLAAAAAYVRPGSAAAAVGCDHGKLAAYLAASGRCPRVIASDVRAQPLARARALCAQLGVQALVDCRLGDGLSVLRPGEVQDIVIAGVSGVTAAQMLAGAPFAFEKGTRVHFCAAHKARRAARASGAKRLRPCGRDARAGGRARVHGAVRRVYGRGPGSRACTSAPWARPKSARKPRRRILRAWRR